MRRRGRSVENKKDPTPAKVLRLHADHPLIGTWVVADDSSSIEFQIRPAPRGFEVLASDSNDGEKFVVSNVRWDGRALRFELLVPSNGTRAEHCFRARPDGSIEDRFTARYIDVLVRKPPKPRSG
jgi:hypothetical protein